MRTPRFRIAWLMAVTAIAALDLAAIRAAYHSWGPVSGLLVSGGLPMANVLAIGLLIACRRRRSRPFLVGFEACGAAALAFYVATILSPSYRESMSRTLLFVYLKPAWSLWPTGAARTAPRVLIAYTGLSLWVTWPQVAFALVGGLVTRFPAAMRAPSRRPVSEADRCRSSALQ